MKKCPSHMLKDFWNPTALRIIVLNLYLILKLSQTREGLVSHFQWQSFAAAVCLRKDTFLLTTLPCLCVCTHPSTLRAENKQWHSWDIPFESLYEMQCISLRWATTSTYKWFYKRMPWKARVLQVNVTATGTWLAGQLVTCILHQLCSGPPDH